MKAVIALGANLGDPVSQLHRAIAALKQLLQVDAISAFHETEPVGVPDEQPNYQNAVLIAQSDLKPIDLMRLLLDLERELGRERTFANAARTIDIDLIDYGGLVMASDVLTLPHPRAHQRAFVLAPWLEIDPAGTLAGRGPIELLLSELGVAK